MKVLYRHALESDDIFLAIEVLDDGTVVFESLDVVHELAPADALEMSAAIEFGADYPGVAPIP